MRKDNTLKTLLQSALISGALAVTGRATAQEEAVADEVRPPSPSVAPESLAIGGARRVVVDIAGFGSPSGGLAFGGGVGALGGSAFAGPFYFTSSEGNHTFGVSPSADLFVTERLSLGGRVTAAWASIDQFHASSFGLSPRIGYLVPISASIAFWPRVSPGADFGFGFGFGAAQTYFVEANAGFAARVSKHVLLDLGPLVTARHTRFDTTDVTAVDVRGRVALRLDF